MKRFVTLSLVLLTTLTPLFAQQKAKRRPGNFEVFGPVQSLREEHVDFKIEGDQLVEGPRELFMIINYDDDGTRLEQTMYHGVQTSKTIDIYDTNNRMLERQQFDRRDVLTSRTIHTRDEQGRLSESVSYRGDGSVSMRSVYRRNGRTEQVETTMFDPKGAVVRTNTATNNQDRSGLQSDRVSSDFARSISTHTSLINKPDGTQEFKEVGSAGNFRHETWVAEKDGRSERVAYNPDGTILKRYRFERELDSYGNIVKATTSVAIGDSIEFKPTTIVYRTYTYYGAAPRVVKQ
jgi:hypothetical protein